MATGYRHSHPHLRGKLSFDIPNSFYPDGLYKGVVFLPAARGRLLFIGAQIQAYSLSMFDCQAQWAMSYILGKVGRDVSRTAMEEDIKQWAER